MAKLGAMTSFDKRTVCVHLDYHSLLVYALECITSGMPGTLAGMDDALDDVTWLSA